MAAPPDSFADWSGNDVCSWLKEIDLTPAERQPFSKVNGALLLTLNIQKLTDAAGPYKLTRPKAKMLHNLLVIKWPIVNWSDVEVGSWITAIGLKDQAFTDNHVNGRLLLELDKEDLTHVSLGLKNVEAKKLLHELERFRPSSEEKRKVIRQLICHENTIYDQRRSHFAVLQGFFWAAASILMESNKELVFVVAAAGILVSIMAYPPMQLSFKAMMKLKKEVDGYGAGLPVIGLHFDEIKDNTWLCCLWFCNSPIVMPLGLVVCWITFICMLARRGMDSDPKEFSLVRNEDVPILIALFGNQSNTIQINITGN